MNIVIYSQQRREPLESFERGLMAHGIRPNWRPRGQYKPCDLAIQWAHKSPMVQQGQRVRGLPYLVLEMGYFGDRKANVSCGFNGINGRAEFLNDRSPGDRWAKHGAEMKPWRTDGEYVLVMGQVLGDTSLASCQQYPLWIARACQEAKVYGLPVRFRPHPKFKGMKAPAQVLEGSLEDALAGAAGTITWNSNSAVDAVLAGVPAIVCDRGGMAYPVAAKCIGDDFIRPDRTQWAHDLAYTQWTWEELASGLAWAHLKRMFSSEGAT